MTCSEDAKRELLSKANVVGAGMGKEVRNGEKTGNECVTVFVTEKMPESELESSDLVPKEVEGNRTDVIPIGKLEIEHEYRVRPQRKTETQTKDIDTTKKHRPFPQGVSIGHPDITAGTAGLILWKKSSESVGSQEIVIPEPVVYTNNHVAANENKAEIGDPILQPGPYDGGKNVDEDYAVGKLEGFVELQENDNKVDGAWFTLNEDRVANSFVLGVGVPTSKSVVGKGDKIMKGNTRTTSYREGEVLSEDARVRVNFSDGVREFEDQIITTSVSRGGDSGSAIFDKRGDWIGNLFAGSSEVSVINKAENILDETPLYLNMGNVYNE